MTAEVESLRERFPELSMSPLALEIHVRTVDYSVRTTSPDFISDSDLDVVGSGSVTTMAAVELCLAGLWHRTVGGYVIDDPKLIDALSVPPSISLLTSCLRACRRAWDVLNRDNFIPL
jgi:hypothetical protein